MLGWLTTTDHKRIGLMYLFATLGFFLAGGVEALRDAHAARRAERRPSSARTTYDQLLTMHGVTMIFLFVIPLTTGAFGNYLVPLMIGARDMAFPRLNALSLLALPRARGSSSTRASRSATAPNAGWFNYVPLALEHVQPRAATSTSTRSG